jgi:hypothetical protein
MKYRLWVFSTVVIFVAFFVSVVVGLQSSEQRARLDPIAVASWEVITFSGNATIRRTKTPKGWIVVTNSSRGGNVFLVYIPDENHTWLKSSNRAIK